MNNPTPYGYTNGKIYVMGIGGKDASNVSWVRTIPGKHLAFVAYSASHAYTDEWGFNGVGISAERVTFARICGQSRIARWFALYRITISGWRGLMRIHWSELGPLSPFQATFIPAPLPLRENRSSDIQAPRSRHARIFSSWHL